VTNLQQVVSGTLKSGRCWAKRTKNAVV